MAMKDEILREKLETLDGSRNRKAIQRAAVRIEDIAALLQLPSLHSAKAAGATPTKAEYDALVADVHAIHSRLTAISTAIQARILT